MADRNKVVRDLSQEERRRLTDCDRRRETNLRIEALRAVSRVFAAELPNYAAESRLREAEEDILQMAGQFARWLESGER